MDSEYKIYIKEKVLEYLRNIKVFYEEVRSNQGAIDLLYKRVVSLKKDKVAEGLPEASSDISNMQELHYKTFLLDQSVKQYQGILYEFNIAAKILGVELDIPEELIEFFNETVSNNPHIFVRKGTSVDMLDNEAARTIASAFKDKLNSKEAISKIYNTI